jgi:hypothetical protein
VRAAAPAPSLKRALSELEKAIHGDAFDAATTTRQFTLAMADAEQIARLPAIVTLLAREMPHARLDDMWSATREAPTRCHKSGQPPS